MKIPSIRDFTTEAIDPTHYRRVDGDWLVAVADVISSTTLVAKGRDREINFVAGAVVAVLSSLGTPEDPVACQFGGDGAVAVLPPHCAEQARAALSAVAHWSTQEFDVPLRVGLVPVSALAAQGHDVLVALHSFGKGNVFGQFLGMGVPEAERWVKADARWRIDPSPGELPGLEGLSCRWRPVPSGRGVVLCVIVDPLVEGDGAADVLVRVEREIEAIVATSVAAPLGRGERAKLAFPSAHSLVTELRVVRGLIPRMIRIARASLGICVMAIANALPSKRVASFDYAYYLMTQAERSDYRKMAGGPRFVLDVTSDEAERIEAKLSALERDGLIHFGLARSDATVMTCLVGDFAADRHVHFVDGSGLGYWRAATVLKSKLHAV